MTDQEFPGHESAEPAGDFDEVERQTRQLLHELGMRSQARELSASDRRRTDAAARAALEEMLSAPRSVPDPTMKPHTVARRNRRLRRWALGGVSLAAAAAIALVLVPPAFDRPAPLTTDTAQDQAATGPAASSTEPSSPAPEHGSADWVRDSAMREGTQAELQNLVKMARQQPVAGVSSIGNGVQRVVTETWTLGDPAASDGGFQTIRAENYLLHDGRIRTLERTGHAISDAGRIPSPAARTVGNDVSGKVIRELVRPSSSTCDGSAECTPLEELEHYADRAVSPTRDAALWRSLAACSPSVCGAIEYVGAVADRLGRDAVAFRVPGQDARGGLTVYADQSTGAVLGVDTLAPGGEHVPGTPAPAIVRFTVIVSVDQVPPSEVP